MKKIVIYGDKGASDFCIASLLSALKYEKIDRKYSIAVVDRHFFKNTNWRHCTHLVIFPGGSDTPYHDNLKGLGNSNIRDFVENGGNFLGICAGGYYGSSVIEFELNTPLEIIAERELEFFPGVAQGPAYGINQFDYRSEKGARIAKIHLPSPDMPYESAAYYNGGCAFLNAEKYHTVSVLAQYADIEGQPAAIIKCHVGKGQAILSGVHPEYSSHYKFTKKHIKNSLFLALQAIEKKRHALFSSIMHCFS
jgi:glutamine amidotransferase-like uncharacterized protein